jgi:hypothetical protein
VILDTLAIDADTFSAGTGWEIKPEGACRGEVCVPLDDAGPFNLETAAAQLQMALIHDADAGIWALGPGTVSGRALTSATAPDLTLADIDGAEFRLSSRLGEKVIIVSWAPY